jgi:hypothetical protein
MMTLSECSNVGKLRKKKPQQQEAIFGYSVYLRKQISQFSATVKTTSQREFVALSQSRTIAPLPDAEVLARRIWPAGSNRIFLHDGNHPRCSGIRGRHAILIG